MSRALLCASLLSACVAPLGCSLLKNADDVVVGRGATDAEVLDSAAALDAATDSPADVLDAVADSGTDAKSVDDPRWALWPMPSPTPVLYVVSAGIVVDGVTKLRWQAAVSPVKRSFATAATECAALSLGGLKGWRLPTRVELVSILTFSPGNVPAINGARFPGTPAGRHWTSSLTALGVYVVDFGTGLIGFAVE
ncbi:MAG: DUF1566 domain-containing protein, partial [Polyangiales bacterium]